MRRLTNYVSGLFYILAAVISSVFVTAGLYLLISLGEKGKLLCFSAGKGSFVDNEDCRKSYLRVYFGICLILKGYD